MLFYGITGRLTFTPLKIYTAEDLKRNALWGVVSNHWRYLTVEELKCLNLILQRFTCNYIVLYINHDFAFNITGHQ